MDDGSASEEKKPHVASAASTPPLLDPSITHPLGRLRTVNNASTGSLQDAQPASGNPGTDSDHEDDGVRESRDLARPQPERLPLPDQSHDDFYLTPRETRGSDSHADHGAEEADDEAAARPVPTEGNISLREWLDKPDRSVEPLECLHVFKQIVDMVAAAHAEGIAVANIRPSCFVLSIFNRISFIESASCSSGSSGSGSDSCNEAGYEANGGSEEAPKTSLGRMTTWLSTSSEWEVGRGGGDNAGGGQDDCTDACVCGVSGECNKSVSFPLKQILLMEFNWYTSPEEAAGGSCSLASDIYKLGVLLFELFSTFGSLEEKLTTMSNLRHRVLPPQLLLKWPKEASFCMLLLHPQPTSRPRMYEVLKHEFLNEPKGNLEELEAAAKLKEDIEDQELLLEFLLMLQRGKQETSEKLTDIIHHISSDIEDVTQILSLKKDGCFLDFQMDKPSTLEKDVQLTSCPSGQEASYLTRKRFRPGLHKTSEEGSGHVIGGSRLEMQPKARELFLSKSSRLMRNFSKLETAYFLTRCHMRQPTTQVQNTSGSSVAKRSVSRTEVSSVDNVVKEIRSRRRNEWFNPFLEGLCKYLSFSDLKVRANLKQGDLLNPSSLVCSIGFDRDKELFATAGVNRKIKVFECDAILYEHRDIHYPVLEMASRSKLSSICWNSYIRSQIASSDFDGVVQVWDVRRGQVIMDLREHAKPVWCIDFSQADPTKLASGGDDGTVKLWNINQAGSLGTIKTKANVCSVQFPPGSGYSVAIGSADHRIYCYDLRNLKTPSRTFVGHNKTVSYVRFIDSSTLVSASTDSSLKLWDLSATTSKIQDNSLLTFTGHTNVKNFVGLSTYDGYIATGSESNEVFVYHRAFPMPVLSSKFGNSDALSGREDETNHFISSLCWRGQSHPHILVAANSSGNIKLLEMV